MRGLSPSARDRDATCQLRSPTPTSARFSRGARTPAPAIAWGVGTTLKLSTRPPRATLVLVGLCLFKGYCVGKRPLHLRCALAVRRACCGLQRQPTPHVSRGAVAPSRAVSGEEAHYLSSLRARDVLRWLWSAYCLRKDTASVERPVSYRCAPVVRRDSCALQRQPAPLVSRGPGAPALATSGGGGAALQIAASSRRTALVAVCL